MLENYKCLELTFDKQLLIEYSKKKFQFLIS